MPGGGGGGGGGAMPGGGIIPRERERKDMGYYYVSTILTGKKTCTYNRYFDNRMNSKQMIDEREREDAWHRYNINLSNCE